MASEELRRMEEVPGIREKKDYWEKRVKEHMTDLKKMVWYGSEFDANEKAVISFLERWKDAKVLEIGCGYGRVAHLFKPENYTGIDFSEEMIALAKKLHPEHKFICMNALEYETNETYDLVFDVMSVGPLGIVQKDFRERFGKFSKGWVASFQPYCFMLWRHEDFQ